MCECEMKEVQGSMAMGGEEEVEREMMDGGDNDAVRRIPPDRVYGKNRIITVQFVGQS